MINLYSSFLANDKNDPNSSIYIKELFNDDYASDNEINIELKKLLKLS